MKKIMVLALAGLGFVALQQDVMASDEEVDFSQYPHDPNVDNLIMEGTPVVALPPDTPAGGEGPPPPPPPPPPPE